MNAMNVVNAMHAINEINVMNAMNALNALNAMNAMNTINAVNVVNALNKGDSLHAMNAMNVRNESLNQIIHESSVLICPPHPNNIVFSKKAKNETRVYFLYSNNEKIKVAGLHLKGLELPP